MNIINPNERRLNGLSSQILGPARAGGSQVQGDFAHPEFRVAVIGGGPGGLFAAWHLAAKAGTACQITIYEASDRLGGKIMTGEFAGAGPYEAGVAEIYDYSSLGPDPLRDLIENELNLDIRHISGGACLFDGKVIQNSDGLKEHFGSRTQDEADAFYQRCGDLLKPTDFYTSARGVDNAHAWSRVSGEDLLANEVTDATARRYIRIMAHSDVAAPPHLTNGLTFLKNALMDVDGYLKVFSVDGGNEQIVHRLADELDADVRLNCPVKSVQPLFDGTYRIEAGVNGATESIIADYVILALPLTALSIIEWKSSTLQQAMARHINYFDRPGHYLRATLLFERPFWREHVDGAWWMSDAFDGCCIYDEGARQDLGSWGALGFLIAGNAALGLANMTDERIEELCLDALSAQFPEAHDMLVDRRIHRWMASVNAIPGGFPVRSVYENHRPNANQFPRLTVIGDYMFDATLNGALDSADAATDLVLADVLYRRRAAQQDADGATGSDTWLPAVNQDLWAQFLDANLLSDLLGIVWGLKPGSRVLHLGSGGGSVVSALRTLGFDAWGVEPCVTTWDLTPDELKPYNLLGEFTDLIMDDATFDVVIDTGLCRLHRDEVAQALAEARRVARRGIIVGSVTTDLTIDLIERHNLLSGVKTLASRWEWFDRLLATGFECALADPARLDTAWKRAQSAGAGPGHWYEDAESLLYCFLNITEHGQSAATEHEPAADQPRLNERVPMVQAIVSAHA